VLSATEDPYPTTRVTGRQAPQDRRAGAAGRSTTTAASIEPGRCTVPRSSIKDERQYQALRRQGESKEKAARIANASAGSSRSRVGKKGGRSPSYDEWSRKELYERAKEIGVEGRSNMNKSELVDALRNH
jgi:hypothetical protein